MNIISTKQYLKKEAASKIEKLSVKQPPDLVFLLFDYSYCFGFTINKYL